MKSLVGSHQWSLPSGVARCTVAISIVLISDAPSESVNHCHSILGRIFNFVLSNDARNVSVRSHSWIAAGAEPNTHHFYVTDNLMGVVKWIETQEDIVLTQKTRPGMQEQVRS
jgi:uncharacterized lipoprotein YbaY